MEKSEQRAALKRLQGIVHGRGDAELPDVVERLQSALTEISSQISGDKPRRTRRGGSNRMESGGTDRSEE